MYVAGVCSSFFFGGNFAYLAASYASLWSSTSIDACEFSFHTSWSCPRQDTCKNLKDHHEVIRSSGVEPPAETPPIVVFFLHNISGDDPRESSPRKNPGGAHKPEIWLWETSTPAFPPSLGGPGHVLSVSRLLRRSVRIRVI